MMSDDQIQTQLSAGAQSLGLAPTPAQLQQLVQYVRLLAKWNHAYNLTAVRDLDEMVSRHLLDSLSIASCIQGDRFVDVGTGPGLPGIPLAILYPQRQFLLVDSNGKKTRFLTQCKLEMQLPNVEVRQARIEQVQLSDYPDGIISRAFASIADFVHWTQHLVGPETRLYAMKGLFPDDELTQLPDGFRLEDNRALRVPGCEGQRHLLIMARAQEPAPV